jgi:MoaA/NifB/PqqE/SkfB family radical SAM enzyme
MCNIWNRKLNREVSLNNLKKIYSNTLFRNVNFLLLTGGEPFILKDFVKRVELSIKSLKNLKIIAIATNGFLTEKIVRDIKSVLSFKKQLVSVMVSLDGGKEVHNKLRGVNFAYKNAMNTLFKLKELQNEYDGFTFGIATTINKYNVSDLNNLFFQHKTITDHYNFTPAINTDFYNIKNDNFAITKKQMPYVIDFYKKLKSESPHLSYFYDKVIYFLKNNKRNFPCLGGILSARLDPYGNLNPCLMMNKKIASLESDYNKKWFIEFDEYRKKSLHKISYCKKCFNNCDMINNYYYEVFDVLKYYVKYPVISTNFITKILKDGSSNSYYSQIYKTSKGI